MNRTSLKAALGVAGLAALMSVGTVVPHAGAVQGEDRVGIYGYVRRVVLEPNAENPKRIQVWGTLSVAAAGPDVAYQAPERGYLYFELPADVDTTLEEWAELKKLADTGGPWMNGNLYGIVGFGVRGATPRVRTRDETPDRPDPYRPGAGVTKVSYQANSPAVKMLGQMPIALTKSNYAVVEKVVLEPAGSQPDRIQIWGVFAMGTADDYAYTAPRRGYLYLAIAPDDRNAESTRARLIEWEVVAGSHEVVGFMTSNANIRLRTPDEKPDAPEPYAIRKSSFTIRPDTEYAPIKALRAVR